jgi:excisionase family DNA binding protein
VILDDWGGRLFVDVREAAAVLGCDERTLRKEIREGRVPHVKTGSRYRVKVAWLRQQAGETPTSVSLDLDELADRVADRVTQQILGAFAALSLDRRTAGPPGPAVTTDDPPPAWERIRGNSTR